MHRLGDNESAHDELRPEQPEQVPGLPEEQLEVRQDRDGEERLGGREEEFLALHRADRQAVQEALEIAKTMGSVPTSSVHWFTFEDTSVPRPAFVFSRHAKSPATRSSGDSEAVRAAGPGGTR